MAAPGGVTLSEAKALAPSHQSQVLRFAQDDKSMRTHRSFLASLIVALVALAVLSASVGAFTFTPAEMWRYVAQGLGAAPLDIGDMLGRNVFLELPV